jgi:pyruvate dehydrogenase E1 component
MGVHTRRPAYRARHCGDEPVPALGAAGLSHSLFGKRLIPIGTVYDPFVARGLDALNYACYQDARFMIVGTPSGVTLAPEGGAHQSIGSPLIGMSQDGLAAFEPAFADELAVIMKWAFDYMQKDGEGDPDERTWLRDETGGSVYLRLTTNPIEQPGTRADEDFRQGAIDGAYWLRKPGPNCEVVIAYQGVVAPEAIRAAGRIAEIPARCRCSGRHLRRPAQRRLDRGTARPGPGNPSAKSHIETLTAALPRHCKIVTVIDGHPATLAWIGSVHGHQTIPLGVEHFGQTGTIGDLYGHFGINAEAIVQAAIGLSEGRRGMPPLMRHDG